MDTFGYIGLFTVILFTAMFAALLLILASFGGYVLLKCADRGWKELKLDERDSARMQAYESEEDKLRRMMNGGGL